MHIGRLLLSSAVLFVVALVWNGVLHTMVLGELNAQVAPLRRANLAELMWLSLPMTAGLMLLFVFGYAKFARTGSVREGLGYGLFFALLAGLLVDLNQYVLYPLPGAVVLAWFAGGLIEFSLYGLLMTKLYPSAAMPAGPTHTIR